MKMTAEDKGSKTGFWREFLRFLRAFTSDWIALVSSVASVALSILAAASSTTNLPKWTFWVAAAASFLVASFRVWMKENRALSLFLHERPPRFEVHGIPTCAVYGDKNDKPYLILPDVTITNPARQTTVSIGVEMWMKMTGGGEAYCAAETSALNDWERDRGNYRNQHLSFPLNLPPHHTVSGYIACAVQRGIAYDRPADPENGLHYFSCRIDFRDYLANPVAVVHQEEIKFYIPSGA